MLTAIMGVLTILKPFLVPLFTFLAGWAFPSPLQKAIDGQGSVHDAETKATNSAGNVSDLDHLP
jgi:hypothetical protein